MKCKYCENNAMITKGGKQSKFCSMSCRSKYYAKSTNEKRKVANLKKYGVENVFQSKEIKEKIKKTCIQKYGVEYIGQSKEIHMKAEQTNLKKYGVKHAIQNKEIQKRQQLAWEQLYGGHPWANIEIRKKREKTLLERYGVQHPILCEQIRKKIEDTNLERYGVRNAAKNIDIAKKIKESVIKSQDKTIATNLKKYGCEYVNQRHIPNETYALLKDKENFALLIDEFSLLEAGNLLNISIDLVKKYINIHKIKLSTRRSSTEKEIYNYIKSIFSGNIQTGRRDLISPLELDIYLPDKNLAIEVNGAYWHSEGHAGKGRKYHLNKTDRCLKHKIQLLHIWDYEWYTKQDIIKSRIINKLLANHQNIYGRKCVIKEISKLEKTEFLNKNHLQGNSPSSIELGLYYNSKLVSMMSFIKSRYNKKYEWEIARFCSALNTSVIGGASKLYSHFVKTYKPASIITYADRRWGEGEFYQKLGLISLHVSPPNYFYTKNYLNFESRMAYQKSKLENKLEIFDPNLTEWENMQANGFDRIWDCGNNVYGIIF